MNYYLDNSAFLTDLTDVPMLPQSKTNYTPWVICGVIILITIVGSILVINQYKKKIENENTNRFSAR